MKKWFTKAHWIELASAARRRVVLGLFSKDFELETAKRHAEWELADRPQFRLETAPGVEILALSVWSEGRQKCKEHCWHKVDKSPRHHDPGNVAGRHYDYVCCRCTNTLCMTCSDIAAAVRPPAPPQHVRVRK